MATWWWKADYVETCNCAHGCPCNLTQIPTDGTCKSVVAWEIREGACDGVRLDGLTLGLIEHWPNPIHKGNGRCLIYIDERADPAQRAALERIGRGDAGAGGPFSIFAATYATPPAVVCGPVRLERKGRRVELALGELARATVAPVKEDLGGEANARLVLPTGFIFTDGDIVNTDTCTVDAPGLSFSYRDTSAFYAQVAYNC
jgi:hypothetical protein